MFSRLGHLFVLVIVIVIDWACSDACDYDGICTKCSCSKYKSSCSPIAVTCEYRNYPVDNPLPVKVPTGTEIVKLAMHGYRLGTLIKHHFSNLQNLTMLNLRGNNVTSLESGIFRDSKIKALILRNNSISSMDTETLPTELSSLDIGQNRITNLTFLRGLKLANLNLNENNISILRLDDLKNSTKPKATISIAMNGLKYIENGTFDGLNIRSLDLSYNVLDHAIDGLHGLCVQRLYLRNISLQTLKLGDMWTFQPGCLTEFDLSENIITDISNGTFLRFRNLRVLMLVWCHIDAYKLEDVFIGLHKLEKLNISHNAWLSHSPDLQDRNGKCATPNLRYLDVSYTGIAMLRTKYFQCLPKLREFYARFTGIWCLQKNIFMYAHQLETVNLYSSHLRFIDDLAFNGSQIRHLNIGHNMYRFCRDRFWSMPNLTELLMESNHFCDKEMSTEFFAHTPRLEKLKMSDQAHFVGFPEPDSSNDYSPFSKLNKLKEINLNRLNLGWIDWNLFTGTMVEKLYVRSDQIRRIIKSQIPNKIIERLVTFDVLQNPFECDCELQDFKSWVCSEAGARIFVRRSKYTCGVNGVKKIHLCDWDSDRICSDINDRDKIITVVAVAVTLIFITVPLTVGLLWRYRYNIINVYLSLKNWYLKLTEDEYERIPSSDDQEQRQLVCYADEPLRELDFHFVMDKLVPLFETVLNVKLLIKDRNAFSGSYFHRLIECIDSSHRVILVVSNQFCDDEVADFVVEFILWKMAKKKNFKRPVIVLREEVSPGPALGLLMAQCRAYTTRWPDEETEEALKAMRTFFRQFF